MANGSEVITIERFIMEQERLYPEATGELSNLLYDLCLAAKIISRHVRRAGLSDSLGAAGAVNVSGDLQQKLDLFANETVRNSVQHTGRVCVTASEEDPAPVPVPPGKAAGKYVVLYDPLDGSMNIDVNVSIGTIFSIHKRVTKKNTTAGLVDCLQLGKKQIAAGYILYGSSTMLVYTTGKGVHGFTLDPTIGEFLLSHPDIRTPPVGRYYSVNESNWNRWTPSVQRVVAAFKNGEGKVQPKNARYIGSLVADFHRNLISGGIFLYPAATNYPQGKLRLLYEAAPLAFVVEQAEGAGRRGCGRMLAAGQTGLSVAFDLPTQMGYDSDHPMAEGEVGRAGVAIDTVDDLARLFDGIPLDRVSTSMTINATAPVLLAMYVVVGEEQGVPRGKLQGTVQNDILKEFIARGTYIYPIEPSLRLAIDVCRFVTIEGMSVNPISVSGYHMREAGATAAQELAFTFANGLEYVRRALAAGLDVNQFAPRLSFFFAASTDLFEEVAKFRAARRLWARLMKEQFQANDAACRLRFHTQTGGSTLTAPEPATNVVRVAIQALAAVLGGTQSLHTNAYDEALALPTEQSATLALRTQQILAHETGIPETVDPAGGR